MLATLLLPPLSRASVSSARTIWSSSTGGITHALHHALHGRQHSLSAASLEEICNTAIPSSEPERSIAAFVARPTAPRDGTLPVLLLLHEFFGLSASIVGKAQLLSDELGCAVIAPDTFRGVTTSFVPRAIWLALTTPQARVDADLDDVVAWAQGQPSLDPSRLAVMGFCYGGGKAIRYTTASKPEAATVIFYGSPLSDAEALARLRAPVCALYGAQDVQFPARTIAAFKAALEVAEVKHEVVCYEGVGHAFWSDADQIKNKEMPQLEAYRVATSFLSTFFEPDQRINGPDKSSLSS
ncbi:hypothetical protein AB1Y20_006170 [Prymnesium parvum]|uniref:Dienelactone hydrolase domain-containing protein n=1 Tax=Prymnesium parvum TaxID=97485 RepID=A0AB34J1I1_PRYPA